MFDKIKRNIFLLAFIDLVDEFGQEFFGKFWNRRSIPFFVVITAVYVWLMIK